MPPLSATTIALGPGRVAGKSRSEIVDMSLGMQGNVLALGTVQQEGALSGTLLFPAGRTTLTNCAFVASIDASDRTVRWISVLPADSILPDRLGVLSDGSCVVGGRQGAAFTKLPNADTERDWYASSRSGLVRLRADGEQVLWTTTGAPNQYDISGLAVDARDRIYLTGGTVGRGMAAYVCRRDAAGKSVPFGDAGGKSSWALYLHPSVPELNGPGQFFDHYNKAKSGGYDYDGPNKGYGKVTWSLYGFLRGGQLRILPGGDFVVTSSLQYRYYVEGGETSPEFDLFVARYTGEGRLVWSSNLYRPGEAVRSSDEKPRALAYDPVSDDVIVVGAQHGSDNYRLYSEHFDLAGDSGNVMVSWVGRLSATTGELKAGWYFQTNRYGHYDARGVPCQPNYPKLSGNDLSGVALDAKGRVLLCGAAGPKMWTTPGASTPWPAEQDGGGQACFLVLSPGLDRIELATVIGNGRANSGSVIRALLAVDDALWLGGALVDYGLASSSSSPLNEAPLSAPGLVVIENWQGLPDAQ